LIIGAFTIDFIETLYGILILPRLWSLPWWVDAFGISVVPSILGSGLLIARILDRKTDRLYRLGWGAFLLPFALLGFLGLLIRLGFSL